MSNPVSTCLGCSKTDDHPRHQEMLPDGNMVGYHLDCCAIVRNCESCRAQLADGPEGAQGDELRAYLITTGTAADKPGWTAPVNDEPTVVLPVQED